MAVEENMVLLKVQIQNPVMPFINEESIITTAAKIIKYN